jgi:site-specific recombinase XerD
MSVKIEYRKDRLRWQVTFYYDGQRRRRLFASELEARNFSRKIQLGISPEAATSTTVEEAIKKYYESVSFRKNKNSKINDKRYLNLLFHFMTEERGIEHLKTVQLDDMEAFRDWLPLQTEYDGKPMKMGSSTVNRLLRVIKHFFRKHVQWKTIVESPCYHLELLEAEENARPPMTKDQFLKSFEAAPQWFKPVFRFIYLTGAPPSCVERLVWSDVDFSSKTIWLTRKKGSKAKWKRVPIPMIDEAHALLLEQRAIYPEGNVFRNESGTKLDAHWCSSTGNKAIKRAGLKGVTLYGLRHALATELTEANVATELVRQALGHSSISTTQKYLKNIQNKTLVAAVSGVRGGLVAVTAPNDDVTHATWGQEKDEEVVN